MSSRRLSDLRCAGISDFKARLGQDPLTAKLFSKGDTTGCTSVFGRRVLVTGAGGSIGSELAAQIAKMGPAHLTLLDACEFNLYQVSYATSHEHPDLSWTARICDIRDEAAMRHLFLQEKARHRFPHAAASKHVPLLEEHNVVEAVRTNVLGTRDSRSTLCCAFGADFVMISTDKAVNPSSCMGLTKRVAEIYVHDRAMRFSGIRASLVRFGNVFGSSGSVVPLFQKQIEAGGPVTITHPELSRFLMTIDEAVRLTPCSASCCPAGLLALCAGYGTAGTNLRSGGRNDQARRAASPRRHRYPVCRRSTGEKLYEELNYDWEVLAPTEVAGVRAAMPLFDPEPKLHLIDQLFAAANARDEKLVKRALIEIVPEYVA